MSREATVHHVNPYELHGVQYFQLLLSFVDAPESLREVRLPHDAVYASPTKGDRVTVETILSMITEVRKTDDQI